jgi:hypothetical protein
MPPGGGPQAGLSRTEFNFAGQTVSHEIQSTPGKIEFFTSEPPVE